MYTSLAQFKEEKLKAFREKFGSQDFDPTPLEPFLSQTIYEAGSISFEVGWDRCEDVANANYREAKDAWLIPTKETTK